MHANEHYRIICPACGAQIAECSHEVEEGEEKEVIKADKPCATCEEEMRRIGIIQ